MLLPLVFNIVLEDLVSAIWQEKEINGILIGKKEVKLSLLIDIKVVFVQNPKESKKKIYKEVTKVIRC